MVEGSSPYLIDFLYQPLDVMSGDAYCARRLNEYKTFYSKESLDTFLKSLKAGIFLSINSATIHPELAESILFGHKKGSFTGATNDRDGLITQANRGTLFLDEIGATKKLLYLLPRTFNPFLTSIL